MLGSRNLLDSASKRSATSKAETAVIKLAGRCEEESKGLIELLAKLKVPARPDGSKPKLKAVQVVLKTMLKNGELESRQRKLKSLERQLCVVRESQDQEFASLKIILDQHGKDVVTRVLDMKDEVQKSLEKLQATVDAGFANIERHRVSVEEKIKIDCIIDSLKYTDMGLRKTMITDAADDQYQWAFGGFEQPPEDDRHTYRPPDASNSGSDSVQSSFANTSTTPGSDAASEDNQSDVGGDSTDEDLNNLEDWLKSDSSLFWICGLPASGKSTVMKFLQRNDSVMAALEQSAPERQVFVLKHYFWVAGSPYQRSCLAMLQNLCYQLLHQRRAVAISACEERFARPQSKRDWTVSELWAMISSIAQVFDVKLFLVIDGLDECAEKEHGLLLKTLATFYALPNVKLVVSSRPWTVFQ
ncbi:hypothetical protein LTR78_009789 [Recurvomyces mirabilis]|uniref:Nephrocystin 3-like N-terminal domain-containing protein n=1 Tax=Recurvomyces mirabilis TaxID=574656 RepID=A0AAE0TMN2_9PEZI|nr:hypothetical protein LTR78_009789 [Recurvomyces mirabilis]KAK5158206.1 hypothetical protein LTS14_003224 [Recurvomyces mirabilis]